MTRKVGFIKLIEGQHLVVIGAPTSPAGALLTRGEVSACTIKVFEVPSDTAPTHVYTVSPSVTADPPSAAYDQCMFATARTDWDLPGSYTFWYRIPVSDYAFEGGKTYIVEAALTAGHPATTFPELDDYGTLYLRWKVVVDPILSA